MSKKSLVFYNKDFDVKHLQFLIKVGDSHVQQIEQWAELKLYDNAHTYATKLEAIVEVMESIYCFYNGGGADQEFCKPILTRFNSFKKLVKNV